MWSLGLHRSGAPRRPRSSGKVRCTTGPHRAVGDQRPDVLDDGGADRRLLLDRPGAQRGGDDRAALAQQRARGRARPCAALHADDDEPALGGERVDVAVEVLRAHVVEDDVGAVAVGGRADLLDEVLLAVVDERRRRRGSRQTSSFSGEPAVVDDAGAERVRELDGHRADAARAAVHQQRLAGPQAGDHEDVGPDRARHLGQRAGGRRGRRRRGRGITWPAGHGDLLGVPAAGEQGAHLVADRPAARRPSPTRARRCRSTPGRGRRTRPAAAGSTPAAGAGRRG